MLSFVKELGINTGDKVSIDWDQYTADVKSSCIWFRSDHKNYCIDNIAKLLMIRPHFRDNKTQEQISAIQYNDLLLKIRRKEDIASVFSERNEKKEDIYRVHNGWVWYSYGKNIRDDNTTVEPSANFITSDVRWFMSIDKNISIDSHNIYRHYYRVCNRVDGSFPQMIDNTYKYREYSNRLFYYNNRVLDRCEWEIFTDDIKTVSAVNNKWDLLKVVYNTWKTIILDWHKETEVVKRPDKFEHKTGNFYSDGENIYLKYWNLVNMTELYKLPPYNDISTYSMDHDDKLLIYKIWDSIFMQYDGKINLKIVDDPMLHK